MTKFRYKMMGANGEVYENTAESSDRFALYNTIRKEGETIVSVEEVSQGGSFDWLTVAFGGVKESQRIVFLRNLGAMIEAGLPVSRALSIGQRQSRNTKLNRILSKVSDSIKKGKSLNEALADHPKVFSPLVVSMVKSGEESGTLSDALHVISDQMDNAYNLKRKIRGALIYPAIIVAAMIVIGILMLIYIVPTLAGTFDELGAELPASTRAIIATSDFLTGNILLVLVLVVGVFIAFVFLMKMSVGKRAIDFILLHIPLISTIVKEVNAARTARTLSSLLASGVEIVTAFSITREVVQNSYFRDVLQEAEEKVQRGESIAKIFEQNTNIYPILVTEMIAVGEETGKLSSMLLHIAEFYEREVEQKTKDMSTVIEPFLMIIVGTAVGFFAVSMITPIYSLSNSL